MRKSIVVTLVGLAACSSKTPSRSGDPAGPGDTRSGDAQTGDSLTGDPLAGDPLTGDALSGDPLAGDPVFGDAGDPSAGDPAAGDPSPGDPTPVPHVCQEACEPGDCIAGTFCGPDARCVYCQNASDCVPHGSGWWLVGGNSYCGTDAECGAGVCVVGPSDNGWCASTGPCEVRASLQTMSRVEGGSASVCVGSDFECSTRRRCAWPCAGEYDCVARKSGWLQDCTQSSGCNDAGYECIDFGPGSGRCARPAAMGCGSDFFAESRSRIEDGVSVDVCRHNETFLVACGGSEGCGDARLDVGCFEDSDCESSPWTPHCDLGGCICETDAECQLASFPGHDACWAGRCGCATAASCSGGFLVHPGTEWACEPCVEEQPFSCR